MRDGTCPWRKIGERERGEEAVVSVAEMPCIPLKERMRSGRCGFLSSHPAFILFCFSWFYFACSNANLERLQVKPPMRERITPIGQRFLILSADFKLRTSPFDHTSKRPSDEEARSFVLGRYNTLALTPEELLIPGQMIAWASRGPHFFADNFDRHI